MKTEIQDLLNGINHFFDKSHYVVKRRRSLQLLDKDLRLNANDYKSKINKIQELYSRKNILIDHKYFELVACSIAVKGIKNSSFGTSYRLLPIHKYREKIRICLYKLGKIGEASDKTSNIIGKCAEVKAINNLLKRESNIEIDKVTFTKAIRPRTLEKIPRCNNCITIFGDEN